MGWVGSPIHEAGAEWTVNGDHTFTAQWEKEDSEKPDKPNTDPEEEDKPSKNNSDKKSSNNSKTNKTETDNEARWLLLFGYSIIAIWVLLGKKKLGNLR